MSSAGGVEKAAERAGEIGCRALQLFVKNNNRWDGPPITAPSVAAFHANLKRAGIEPAHVFAHTSYLINLASARPDIVEKSIAALEDELRRCEQLGIMGLVMHPGSPGPEGDKAGAIRLVAERARAILKRVDGRVRLLYETTAGTGNTLGRTFGEMAELLDLTGLPNVTGVCLDTCHIFAAGHDIRTPETFAATFAEFDATVGFGRLSAIHLNDSKMELGSRRDRHEHIGKGCIGEAAFRLLLNDPRFDSIPMALETEKDDEHENDRMNLAVLARLERPPRKRPT